MLFLAMPCRIFFLSPSFQAVPFSVYQVVLTVVPQDPSHNSTTDYIVIKLPITTSSCRSCSMCAELSAVCRHSYHSCTMHSSFEPAKPTCFGTQFQLIVPCWLEPHDDPKHAAALCAWSLLGHAPRRLPVYVLPWLYLRDTFPRIHYFAELGAMHES